MFEALASLYLTFWKIGSFAFGGGLAVLKLIEQDVVRANGWMTGAQFAELVALSEMTPGPIAINAATFVGVLVAGVPGAVAATLGVVTTSFVLMTLLAKLVMRVKDHPLAKAFFKGLRPVIAGLIVCAALAVGTEAVHSEITAVLAAGGFLAAYKFKAHPILIIVIAAVIGVALF
ncbi:MAG: chromate transporter [Clostridia bacterium]|nr:chromate transporter [Clostridia bacterium]